MLHLLGLIESVTDLSIVGQQLEHPCQTMTYSVCIHFKMLSGFRKCKRWKVTFDSCWKSLYKQFYIPLPSELAVLQHVTLLYQSFGWRQWSVGGNTENTNIPHLIATHVTHGEITVLVTGNVWPSFQTALEMELDLFLLKIYNFVTAIMLKGTKIAISGPHNLWILSNCFVPMTQWITDHRTIPRENNQWTVVIVMWFGRLLKLSCFCLFLSAE